jgi:hypothetical protein
LYLCSYNLDGFVTKMVTNTHIVGKWMWQGGQEPTCHAGQPHHGATRCPTCPFHVTDPWERSSKTSPALILSRFAPMVMMEWSWIHGSTVMDLEPSNRPWNRLTSQIFACAAFTTAFGSQPRPYDGKAVKSYVGRHPTTPPGAQVSSIDLLDVYKYPLQQPTLQSYK